MGLIFNPITKKGKSKMKEYGIINIHTNEINVMFGHNPMDAYERSGFNASEWVIDYVDYID